MNGNPLSYTNLTLCNTPSRMKPYLGIDDEYFALRDANFQVTDFVSVTVPKTCIKWVAVLGKEVPNVLNTQWTLSRQGSQPTPVFSLYQHKVLASSDLSYSIVFECWELRREEYLKACNFEFVRSSSNNCMTSNALIRKNYPVFSHGSWVWPASNYHGCCATSQHNHKCFAAWATGNDTPGIASCELMPALHITFCSMATTGILTKSQFYDITLTFTIEGGEEPIRRNHHRSIR